MGDRWTRLARLLNAEITAAEGREAALYAVLSRGRRRAGYRREAVVRRRQAWLLRRPERGR